MTKKAKLYRCLECGEAKPLDEFPINLEGRTWNTDRCWDCIEDDEDGYVVMLS